jgi:hypothetical protein
LTIQFFARQQPSRAEGFPDVDLDLEGRRRDADDPRRPTAEPQLAAFRDFWIRVEPLTPQPVADDSHFLAE